MTDLNAINEALPMAFPAPDGALLSFDERAGMIYRINYSL